MKNRCKPHELAQSAFYILMLTFVGLALGPYSIGLVSDVLAQVGYDDAQALRYAMTLGLAALIPATINLVISSRSLHAEEESRIDRAKALGESV